MSNLFDAQTKDQIESRMVQTLHTLTDTDKTAIEGSFARDMIDTNAVEFENSYAEMAMLRDAAFAEKAWGDYLTLRAEEFGIQRKKSRAGQWDSDGYRTVRGLHHPWQSVSDQGRAAVLHDRIRNDSSGWN